MMMMRMMMMMMMTGDYRGKRQPVPGVSDHLIIIIIIIIIIVSLCPQKWPLIAHYLLQKAVNCSFCDTSTAHLLYE
jgi:hypothetical protein